MDDTTGNVDGKAAKSARLLGSLKDALRAAGRDDVVAVSPPALPAAAQPGESLPRAAEAARLAKAPAREEETAAPPTTRVLRREAFKDHIGGGKEPAAARTQLVRGKQAISRTAFEQDPVVGFLIVVGGPGLGAFRPVFEGNNTIGRGAGNRIALDFGDETISQLEQAYVRYDSSERAFLFVPNLAKTNVVSLNDKRPTGAVPLKAMDVITLGRTQVAFVPFCGPEFDWSEIPEA